MGPSTDYRLLDDGHTEVVWRAALIVFSCLALNACGGPGLRPDANGLRLCRAGEVRARWEGTNAATGGQMLANVILWNRSDEPRALLGVPDAVFILGDGTPYASDVQHCADRPAGTDAAPLFACDASRWVMLEPAAPEPALHTALQPGQATFLLMRRIHDGAAKKGRGFESKLAYMGHALMENRHGLLVDFQLTQATGTAERDVVPRLLYDAERRGFHPRTLGADKAYDARGVCRNYARVWG